MRGRGVCVAGRHACQGGVRGRGGMHGRGACMAGGACMARETVTAADGTHSSGMHSC